MLDKQVVPISFAQGLDTKSDPKNVIPGKLTLLENGIFNEGKAIRKRNGYSALSNSILGSTSTIGVSQGLFAYNEELLRFSNFKLYSYSESNDSWADKGSAASINVSQRQISRNNLDHKNPDVAESGGVRVFIWTQTEGANVYLRANAYDSSNNAPLLSNFLVSQNGAADVTTARVISCSGKVFVYYVYNTSVYLRIFDPQNPTTMGAETVIGSTDSVNPGVLDVALSGSNMILSYVNSSGSNVKFEYINSNGVVGSPGNGFPSATTWASGAATQIITTCVDPVTLQIYMFAYSATDQKIKYVVYNSDFTLRLAVTDIFTGLATRLPVRMGCVFTTNAVLFAERTGANIINAFIIQAICSNTAVVSTDPSFVLSLGLASRPFYLNSRVYFLGVFQSLEQATYFLIDESKNIIAKSGELNAAQGSQGLNSSVVIDGTSVSIAGQIQTSFDVDNGTFFTNKGIAEFSFDLNPDNNFYARELNDLLHTSGGIQGIYDGVSLVENNFNIYPEGITTAVATTGGFVPVGTFLYNVVYAWYDNQGNIHRGAPSLPISVTTTTATSSVTLTIPCLRITAKKAPRNDVMIEIYRTGANGTSSHRITSSAAPLLNVPTANTVSYVDNATDVSIASNELLYTTGGVLDNFQAPAHKVIENYKNRMFVAGLEDPLQIAYSKIPDANNGIYFNPALVIDVNPLGGNVTAIKFMDDKLLIFKENLVFAMAGDGPNNLGQQDTFSIPELISSDCGCPFPNSIVLMPRGVMFKSHKGIYICDRSLNISYIGADVEAYNPLTVNSADLLQDENQVRFLTKDGDALLFDYFFNQWSVFTNHTGIDADVWKGAYVYLRTDGTVYKETLNYFKDNLAAIKLRIATAWLKFAGPQAFQRIRRFAVLGNYYSPHILKVSIGYDYESYYRDQVLYYTSVNFPPENVYGGTDPALTWGETTPWGGEDDGVYQFRSHIAQQKCEAIRFLFEDLSDPDPGEGYSISDLSLEVGVKRGINKLKTSKSLG